MNILFVGKRNRGQSSGIEKKMMDQINAFEKCGHKVRYIFFENDYVCLSDTEGNVERLVLYKKNVPSEYLANERAIREAVKKHPDFFHLLYMRKGLCSPIHLKSLSILKKNGIMIVEEIPTYPYDKELLDTKGVYLKVFWLIDNLSRKSLKKYVSKIVTYSLDKQIFGIDTICINNGIDVESVPMKENRADNTLFRILTVSTMYFWHGYDRLIKGLAEYYKTHQNRDVYIDMVGDGPCRKEWEILAKKLGIEKYVIFHGSLCGEKLDELYNQCDVAAASLGYFRKGMSQASELKIREYCSRGVPFLLANEDLELKNERFMHYVSNDDLPVNIENVIEFVAKLGEKEDCTMHMRNYALEKLGWERQIKKIMDKI